MPKKNPKSKFQNPKVIVAMSGGVDSSVAAALLKRAGFNVIGVFMRLWGARSEESEARARKVARVLKIPFRIFNLQNEFKKKVADVFLKEYGAGRTPNPCIICNKEIKFGLLLEKSLAWGADYIATGHYVRLVRHRVSNKILEAKDKNKDQSYFLWKLDQEQIKHVLFPVGGYKKAQVRALAKKFGLPTWSTPASQEICFVPNTINEFLKRYFKPKKGPVVEQVHYGVNKIVGQHRGLVFYTIGQRKGIGLPQGPYWVKDKDFKKNVLIVTKNEKDLLKKELIAADVNWILGKEPKLPLKIQAKIRYRSRLSSATINKIQNTKYKILFGEPQRAITPGQSVVFYLPRRQAGKGLELLGGGIIS